MTLEEMIALVNEKGLRLNNLFQLWSGSSWQANLTDGEKLWEFGTGSTPQEALLQALHKVHTTEGATPLEALQLAFIEGGLVEPKKSKPTRTLKSAILALDLDLG